MTIHILTRTVRSTAIDRAPVTPCGPVSVGHSVFLSHDETKSISYRGGA